MINKKHIDLVIGTRPNIIKAAPLYRALEATDWAIPRLVFLQQHTDPALSTQTLEDVHLAEAKLIGIALSGADLGDRLGSMISGYGRMLSSEQPDLVVVFGDVDTTLAASIAAKRHGIQLAHVEAGLRSNDRTMPEELNRLMVDAISDFHLTTTKEATETLLKEGHSKTNVHFTGNLMIDSLLATIDEGLARTLSEDLRVDPGEFILATFHRPSNVDTAEGLKALAAMLREITALRPVLLPLHPRTRAAITKNKLEAEFSIAGLRLLPPLRYRHFVSLLSIARAVISDSGGLQEECSVLGITCLTVRENTERPDTLSAGNELTSPTTAAAKLTRHLNAVQQASPVVIPMWDGKSAPRIANAIKLHLSARAT